ncbi:MAG: aminotransferase class V-fold PLP-dependent enzyme, partial [Actinomycetota bacterium]
HLRTDVTALDADFVVFSGHKIYGPTGIGALYAKRAILESMPPWEGGGNMIEDVTFEKTVFHGPPARFEAGTGNIADAVGLGAALDYVTARGIDAVGAYEHGLIEYMVAQLAGVRSLQFIGSPTLRAGAVSFVLEGRTTHEVGAALNREGIAVRSGHHCAQPILRRFGVETSVRPSVALYNTTDDIDALIDGLNRIVGSRR